MTDISHFIQLVSIFGIVVPLVVSSISFRTVGIQFRLFSFFLLVGFLTDVIMYTLLNLEKQTYLMVIFNCYSLLEAGFFYWFIAYTTKSNVIKLIAQVLAFVTLAFWILVVVIQPSFIKAPPTQLFDPFYEVGVAFLAGFALLQFVEAEEKVTAAPGFWVLLGIFFYCFCTFFIMGFLNTMISRQIWFLNNLINIITYLFYTVGAWKLRSQL